MEGNCSNVGFNLHQNRNRNRNQACVVDNNVEKAKNSRSEDDVKSQWIDKSVKLMITALSYLNEEDSMKKHSVLQGKWKLVSKAMEERGYHVSSQQCEDKFNDLNKRYKKLNEMLGRGICCDVVENPMLLDKIDYLNEVEKDEVRRILSSKHLFYEEMCSYHNGNRLHLPHDLALQRFLRLMLRNRDDDYGVLGGDLKRLRRSQSDEDVGQSNGTNSRECDKGYENRGMSVESRKVASLPKQWIESRYIELEEQKLRIRAELMELERQRLKWEMFSKKRDEKLEKMRMENEKMKLENEMMTLELKRVELGARFMKN
ncbi:hypothetical protein AALP_AA2G210700 [Arabis alpina]|uniref:Myb/SANT-like DNA-binding domain-containing protein n=1 Tax=Arabis alpina TaxID=50452 RepID=A0A087HIZ8_ARAAL|nr:hypothetical protein AALP_AA2G210700 [Arabis alpina]